MGIDLEPGWLMRALLADPEYQEIVKRIAEKRDRPPPVAEHVDPHAEINARIRRTLHGADEGPQTDAGDESVTLI